MPCLSARVREGHLRLKYVGCRGTRWYARPRYGPDDLVFRVGEANPCHAKSPGFHKDPAYFGKKPVLCPEMDNRLIGCGKYRI